MGELSVFFLDNLQRSGIGTESGGEREQGHTAQLLLSFYLTWRVAHAFMHANLSTTYRNAILAFMDLLTL